VLGYAARRLTAAIPVLLAASALTFMLAARTSDPTEELRLRQPPVSEATVAAIRGDLYLDRPVLDRYWLWLTGLGDTNGDIGLLQGKWGPSVRGIDIGGEIGDRLLITVRLVGAALTAAFALALLTGSVAAARRGSNLDRAITAISAIGIALPTFWLATLLKAGGVWFNEQVGVRVFYTVGATSPGYGRLSLLGRLGDIASHLVLPTLALLIGAHAVISRHHRAAMIEAHARDHVRVAQAKGLSPGQVVRRHELRNALIPATTVFSLLVAGALTGAVIVEQTFRWRGMGTFLLEAMATKDHFAVLAFLAVSTAIIIVAGLVADLAYALLDPRIRRG
jgi:peptide/nickel transport system permease protein